MQAYADTNKIVRKSLNIIKSKKVCLQKIMLITSTKTREIPICRVLACNPKPKLLLRSIHFFHSSRSSYPVSWCSATVRLYLGELLLIENNGGFSFDLGESCLGSPTTCSRINLSTLLTLGSNSRTNWPSAIGCTFSFIFIVIASSLWSINLL